jgi:hypothetical protein
LIRTGAPDVEARTPPCGDIAFVIRVTSPTPSGRF